MSKAEVDGGCLCGGARYRLHELPIQICDCHCIDCRRGSAAPFVTWGSVAGVEMEILSGELRRVKHEGRIRSFAACCGTPLFFQEQKGSEWIDITVASLDHPEMFPPEAAIWTEDQLPWVKLNPSHPTYSQGRPSSA